MGIFAKQGPYQEFKDLFVKEFDADKTIKTLNDKYAELDKLSLINKTPALTYEQKEADKIQTTHQAGITKATEIGEIDPWKAMNMTQSLAHSYVNDRERLNYERSLAKKQESDKLAGDNPNAVGAALESEGLHSLKGGSPKEIYRGYTPFKAIDAVEKVSKIANMINADSTDEKIKLQQVGNTIRLTGHEHEYISQAKVQKTASYLLNDPEVVGDFRNKSYAELSPVAEKIILQQNPNLSEMQLKAEVYKMLTTPKKETIKVKQVVNGKEVLKDKTIVTTELEKAINNKKNNMIAGLVDAVSYDKYKNSESFYNIPAGSGSNDDESNYPAVLGTTTDNPLSSYTTGDYTDNLTTGLKSAEGTFSGVGTNLAIAAVNIGKTLSRFLPELGENPDVEFGTLFPKKGQDTDVELEKHVTQKDIIVKQVNLINEAKKKAGIDTPTTELNEDGSNLEEVVREAYTTSKFINSAIKEQSQLTVIPVYNERLRKVVANSDLNTLQIKYKDSDGRKMTGKMSDLLENGDLFSEKIKTPIEKSKYVKENLTVSNLTSVDGKAVFIGELGGKSFMIEHPMLKASTGFQPLIAFNTLTTSDKKEMPLPIESYTNVKKGYNKIVKHSNYDYNSGNVTFTYSLSNGKTETAPVDKTTFYNNYLQPDITKSFKNTQLRPLFYNLDQSKSDMIE